MRTIYSRPSIIDAVNAVVPIGHVVAVNPVDRDAVVQYQVSAKNLVEATELTTGETVIVVDERYWQPDPRIVEGSWTSWVDL